MKVFVSAFFAVKSPIRNRMTFSRKKAQDAQIGISPLVPFAPFRGHPPNPQSAIRPLSRTASSYAPSTYTGICH
jgi:hypothetical protein